LGVEEKHRSIFQWEGIFYTQAASRGYLKLLAFFLIWQKKTTVSLKIPIIVRV